MQNSKFKMQKPVRSEVLILHFAFCILHSCSRARVPER
jgi:hypothetical protein